MTDNGKKITFENDNIRVPNHPLIPFIEGYGIGPDIWAASVRVFDAAVKNMHKTAADQTQKCQKYYKMEFQTIGKAFQQLGNALQQDGNYRKLKLLTKMSNL